MHSLADGVSQAFKQLPGFRDAERVRRLRLGADEGRAQAQFDLGVTLLCGQYGQKVDKEKGQEWLGKAADGGHTEAMSVLASILYNDPDPAVRGKAVTWLRRAAELGNVHAQYKLAVRHQTGNGVERDFGEAARWLQRAAELGHRTSQYMLAEVLLEGEGVPKSRAEAERWLETAAHGGCTYARHKLNALRSADEAPASASDGADEPTSSAATTPARETDKGAAKGDLDFDAKAAPHGGNKEAAIKPPNLASMVKALTSIKLTKPGKSAVEASAPPAHDEPKDQAPTGASDKVKPVADEASSTMVNALRGVEHASFVCIETLVMSAGFVAGIGFALGGTLASTHLLH
ncbi:hypothetical protein KFE25_003916 [Diacronema lutheri]|uniref:Sel1 repeat family protein n=1 Tax=Diacronema lutheri TaxID=2081491 RepID=A0A8J6CDK8_DIALT|nr:hypothetical protein KFE25_003916 [Diacronema lutheri]